MPYTYDTLSFRYYGFRQPIGGQDCANEPGCTDVEPPEHIQQTIICWDPVKNAWYYSEWVPGPGEKDIMNDILTYADLRALEYPPMTDYLDAIVKNDDEQKQRYVNACMEVKNRWPKDMDPITRRQYFVMKYAMRPV